MERSQKSKKSERSKSSTKEMSPVDMLNENVQDNESMGRKPFHDVPGIRSKSRDRFSSMYSPSHSRMN